MSFMTPCQILCATKNSATPHPILAKYLVQVQYYVAKFYMAYCVILSTYLVQAQDHATKFSSMHCTITHAIESFAMETPCSFVETLWLLLETLFHVQHMMAIEAQKLISYTSDVAHAKVITTGEPTTPSLLIPALPSINNFFAGGLLAHDLLQAQPATSQRILRESVALDDPPF